MALLAALAAALAVQPAAPLRDWQEVGESDQGSLLAYDRASIRLDRARMLARFDYRLRRKTHYSIARIELRCADRLMRVVRTQDYTLENVPAGRDDQPTDWAGIPAGSSFETVEREACPAAAPPAG